MSVAIKHVTDTSFNADVLQSAKPVLVDYWADWCAPCKMIAPVLDEAAENFAEQVQFAKINIDENQLVPNQYGVRGIPTLMLFKEGNLIATKVGALSKSQLAAFIETNL